MYINVISKEIVSLRPDNYMDAVSHSLTHSLTHSPTHSLTQGESTQGAALSEDEMKQLQSLQNPSNNLPMIRLTELLEELDRIVEVEKKTPFLIDTSEEQKCRTYFSYKVLACYSLTHSLTMILTHSLTHSLTHYHDTHSLI